MRKTTKAILTLGAGAVLSLGLVFGSMNTDIMVNATNPNSGSVQKRVEIQEPEKVLPVYPQYTADEKTGAQIAEEKRQEKVNAETREYFEEGSKTESKTVDGVTSEVPGLYYLNDVKGLAITVDRSYYNTEVEGLNGNPDHAQVTVYETNESKSPQAYACVKEALAGYSENAVLGPSVNIQTRWPAGEEGSDLVGTMKMGLNPTFAKDGSKYAVVAIYPGGFYQIYEDEDDNPDTVSFRAPINYTDNLAMYTMIRIDG